MCLYFANENISSVFLFRNLLPWKISSVCNSSTLQLVRKKNLTVKMESYFNLANPKPVLPSEFPGSLGTCSRYLKFAKNNMEYLSSDKLSLCIGRKALENTLKIHSSNIYTNDKSDIKKTTRCLEFPRRVFLFLSNNSILGDCEEGLYFSEIPAVPKLQLGSYMFEKSRHVHFAYFTVNQSKSLLFV